LYAEIRRNAKIRGIGFEMDLDTFIRIASMPCYYCGADPQPRARPEVNGAPVALHGIDRVDSAGAYAPGNIVSCCGYCNRAKSSRSEVEFIAWARRVVEHSGNRRG